MRKGDIVLFQGSGLLGEGIEAFTEGGFCHAAIAVSDTEIAEALSDGVDLTAIKDKKDKPYAVYEVIDITPVQREAIASYALAQVGTKYGYLQDAGFALNYIRETMGLKRIPDLFKEHGKIICSALVDVSLRSAGIVLRPDRDAGDVTPIGLIYSDKLKFIENHNLKEA